MKKIIALICFALVVNVGLFAFKNIRNKMNEKETVVIDSAVSEKLEDTKFYPLYESLDKESQNWYKVICTGAENFEEEVFIGEYASKDESSRIAEKIEQIYSAIFYEQADYFWVDAHSCNIILKAADTYELYIGIAYNMDKSLLNSRKNIFEKEVEKIVSAASKQPTLYDKVLYVYDYILENTEYDYAMAAGEKVADFNRSAYGSLVTGKTVCSGYSLAFQLIMRKLGVVCGSEFNDYSGFEIEEGHVWNYCLLDDEYYYFDLTWDDTAFDSTEYKKFFDYSHNFFAITTDELKKSHDTDDGAPTPYCGGTKYNYFVKNGVSFAEYNRQEIVNAVLNRKNEGFVALRFDSSNERIKAQNDLLKSGRIYDYCVDGYSISHTEDESGLHLYIFFEK